jgi:DNA-binding beta-propeller fold protein YncE
MLPTTKRPEILPSLFVVHFGQEHPPQEGRTPTGSAIRPDINQVIVGDPSEGDNIAYSAPSPAWRETIDPHGGSPMLPVNGWL